MIQQLRARWALAAAMIGGLFGCIGDTPVPAEPSLNPTGLYWRLTLNQKAINLTNVAPYDTFRLVATPRTVDGTPIEGLGTPTFRSLAPDRVRVSPDGLVLGLRAGQPVQVEAKLSDPVRKLSRTDTALVRVVSTATPPTLARLSLEPNPADSAKGTMQGGFYFPTPTLNPRAFDAADAPIANLAIWIESSDPSIATYNNVQRRLTLVRPGPVTFIAHTIAYGVEAADTLEFVVGVPLATAVQAQPLVGPNGTTTYRFNPATLTVGAGGYVWWFNQNGAPPFDVTFDDPTHVAADTIVSQLGSVCIDGTMSGNIAPFGAVQGMPSLCSRRFPVPGTYTYHSEVLGTTGTIVVVDESQPAAAQAPSGTE